MRILVVDDQPDMVESLSLVLTLLGHDPRPASSGKEALEVLASWDAGLGLVDVGMPEMSGYDLATRIRERYPDRRLVLVALTGWAGDDDRQRALDAGFDRHVTKPIDLEALQALLVEVSDLGR